MSSLVIDAPEASLDGIFVTRAAEVFATFAQAEKENRLIITSNLVEGDLLPELISRATQTPDQMSRILDLLEVVGREGRVEDDVGKDVNG